MSRSKPVAGEGGPATWTVERNPDGTTTSAVWDSPLREIVDMLEQQGLECLEIGSWIYFCHSDERRVLAADLEVLELVLLGPRELEEAEKELEKV